MAATAPTVQYTRTLAEFAQSFDLAKVPEDVIHEGRRAVLDAVGCAIAGIVTPAGKIAVDLAREERGPLMATVITAGKGSIAPAVFANTVLTNAIDYDVYGPEGHVAPVALPVAMAVADAVDASGAEMFAGFLAGMEVGGRVGGALRRPNMGGARALGNVRGHGHCAFAAAAAAGRILKLTPDQMHHAFGIAGYGATVPTLRKFFASPHAPMTKYDHLGAMAQNGLQAALLAQRGFTGDLEVLEGEDIGFWRFAGGQGCDWDHLVNGLGSEWTMREVSYKPYPVGLYTGPSIETVRRMAAEQNLRPEDIDHIEVRTTRVGDTPERMQLRHSLDAWLSTPYTITAGLFDVRPRRAWQEPQNYQRQDLLDFMKRISFAKIREGELKSTGNYWERWSPVRVTITARGQSFEGGQDYLPMLDDEALKAKFHENLTGLMSEEDAQHLARHCWELPNVRMASQLTELLTRVKRP